MSYLRNHEDIESGQGAASSREYPVQCPEGNPLSPALMRVCPLGQLHDGPYSQN